MDNKQIDITNAMKEILIIEDDPGQQNLLQMFIKYSLSEDIVISKSAHLKDALQQLENKEFDIIICDLRLPYSQSLAETIEKVSMKKQGAVVFYCSVEEPDNDSVNLIDGSNSLFISKNLDFLPQIQEKLELLIKNT